MTNKWWICVGAVGWLACSSSSPEPGARDLTVPGGGATSQTGGVGTGGGGVSGSGGQSVVSGGVFGSGGLSISGGSGPEGGNKVGVCASAELTASVTSSPGNLLVLFDRSTSMSNNFQGQSRLEAVDAALTAGLAPFVCQPTAPDEPPCLEKLTVAALLFPSADSGFGSQCVVDVLETPTQISWRPVGEFVDSWVAYWQGPNAGLRRGTPIPRVFQRAEEALSASTLPGSTAVLFLTDGETSCNEGVDAVAQARMWADRGIKTYVVSVAPGISPFNDQVATAGGTGQSINPADSQQLSDELSTIISETSATIDCTVTLDGRGIANANLACQSGTVEINGNPIACEPADGFQISGANELKFFGRACDALGLPGATVTAEFPCDALLE